MKNNFKNLFKNKSFYMTLGVCALALCAAAGIITYENNKMDEQLAKNAVEFQELTDETIRIEDGTYMDSTNEYNADQVQNILDELAKAQAQSDALAANTDEVTGEKTDETVDESKVGFEGTKDLMWPVSGTVLLDYSMDTTVYYKTLDQYKCNPGMLIGTEANMPVNAVGAGTVTSVVNDAVLGQVVTIDMGNGYAASYGQLKDITVSEGDTVDFGQVIGYVAQPTKYFGEDGVHLNFSMTKDGKPVDPKQFFK